MYFRYRSYPAAVAAESLYTAQGYRVTLRKWGRGWRVEVTL